MILKKYGVDALFFLPLIEAGAIDYETSFTPAAGDVKLWSYGGESPQISTNVAAEMVAFTSGSEEPVNGDTIVGATSTETATFMFAVVTSGTWGGGDAAGFLFAKSVSGAFQAENINISGGSTNVLTIGADFTAGLTGNVAQGDLAVALTASEMECEHGRITLIDSATKAVEDNKITFETYGDTNAMHAIDFDDSVRAGLTALPNAVPDSSGGLATEDASGHLAVDVREWLGTAVTTSSTTNKPEVDINSINDSAAAAIRLALSAGQIIPGTVDTATNGHTPTTTEFQADDITESTADHFNGRRVVFTSGNLAGQATSISDYSQVGGIGQFTVVALTEAPANNDTFIIV